MQTYKKIFVKIVLGFLSVYVIMMGLFTYIKAKDIQREYRNHIFTLLFELQDTVKESVEEGGLEEDLVRGLNLELTRALEFSKEYQIYGVAGVSKASQVHSAAGIVRDQQYIAQSGYYMENQGKDINLEDLPEGEKYINLQNLFSDEELVAFLEPFEQQSFEQTWRDIEKRGIINRLKLEGYSLGDEVIPTVINHYTIQKSDYGWSDEDEVLKHTYNFDIKMQNGMRPYKEEDWWNYVDVTYSPDLNRFRLDLERVERIKRLKEQMYKRGEEYGNNREENLFKMDYACHTSVETDKGFYGLTLAVEYEPLSIAIGHLKTVYLFSIIIVLVMSLILARGMHRTYQKEQQLEKTRRDLIDAVAHELKTPLAIIRAYGEGLQEKIAEDKKDEYIEVIIDETDRMNQLIVEMLYLSKIDNQKCLFNFEIIQLPAVVEKVLVNLQPLINEKEIEVKIDKVQQLAIHADEKAMEKVISNLLINAIQHTYLKGKIEIVVDEEGIQIENEGNIIPEQQLVAIWDVFYKTGETAHRTREGSGLGLSIVKKLLEAHEMKYGAVNTASGVKFWIKY